MGIYNEKVTAVTGISRVKTVEREFVNIMNPCYRKLPPTNYYESSLYPGS